VGTNTLITIHFSLFEINSISVIGMLIAAGFALIQAAHTFECHFTSNSDTPVGKGVKRC